MKRTAKVSTRQSGVGKLTLLVFGTIGAVVMYTGFQVLPFYYYYFELLNQMEAAIKVASTETDAELRKKLIYHIRKMELPVGSNDQLNDALHIEREDNMMRIQLSYEEVFSLTWGEKEYVVRRFPFDAYTEGRFK